jgi:5-(carboxyamino)imidazole ribonucleotide synthase
MSVAVLGNGQLGAMLKLAGNAIGVDVALLDIDGDQLPAPDQIVTAEREHWPVNPLTHALQQHPGWLNAPAFAHLPDRRRQKELLDRLGLPTSPWCIPSATSTQAELHAQLGPDVFLKSASGGYDGRGQLRLKHEHSVALPDWASAAIAEQAIGFSTEVSLVGARAADGSTMFYRLTENRHQDGVLMVSISIEQRFAHLQRCAEDLLARLMTELDYVGVMAVELFVKDDQLLINEIAPRVHNSGHWTQAGASVSQFEMHIRAVCGLPLVQPVQSPCALMVNLLGVERDLRWMEQPAAQFHWYGKSWRAGRKMGHINFDASDCAQLGEWLARLPLPDNYQGSVAWAQAALKR